MAGINRAIIKHVLEKSNAYDTESYFEANASAKEQKPCIFLSHISIDKESAIEIGNYITQSDIDIYLDIYDEELQRAVVSKDAKKITQFIQEGIDRSTHLLCLISNDTKSSWWVPYELGYGKCASKEVASLSLKEVDYLPEYLSSEKILQGTESLNRYLKLIVVNHNSTARAKDFISEATVKHSQVNHPLDSILKWRD
ncbi:toll/interleukin-1 receptor domain-containing protein [Vibrio alginolyticus]